MKSNELNLIPSNIVMEKYVDPAINYYRKILDKISPYFFRDNNLIKMLGFQQLIISKHYQIRRKDARSNKGIDYIRECVSQIDKPIDLLKLMKTWHAFDLNLTAPSFVNPLLATNIRKSYCKVGNKYFDCPNCDRIVCKNNLLWNESTIMLDCDTEENKLRKVYNSFIETLESLNFQYAIKISSLHGFHINIGLPKDAGETLFERSIYHYAVTQELIERGLPVDDNSLDPVPIMRAPFSLHYRRLTPSLPVNDKIINNAIELLKEIEEHPLEERIALATPISKEWELDWFVNNSPIDAFSEIIKKWRKKAISDIYREKKPNQRNKTNVGDYLRKGNLMSPKDEKKAFELLLKEGKSPKLAHRIIEITKKKKPKKKRSKKTKVKKDIILKTQNDIPEKVLNLPPPLLLLIIDNSTIKDMVKITGVSPLKVKALCSNTDEGFKVYFHKSKLLKYYPRKWQCKSIYIGGLYTSYNYCAAADLVVAVKMKNVWDRDIKILKELEKKILEFKEDLIVAHLLGLDFCKDNDLDIEGSILIFKKFIKKILNTNFNVVLTTDHSGEDYIPYFELLTY